MAKGKHRRKAQLRREREQQMNAEKKREERNRLMAELDQLERKENATLERMSAISVQLEAVDARSRDKVAELEQELRQVRAEAHEEELRVDAAEKCLRRFARLFFDDLQRAIAHDGPKTTKMGRNDRFYGPAILGLAELHSGTAHRLNQNGHQYDIAKSYGIPLKGREPTLMPKDSEEKKEVEKVLNGLFRG